MGESMDVLDTKTANQLSIGSPGVIRIGGQTYLASQPTKADFGTLNKFLIDLWKRRNKSPITEVAKELAEMPDDLRALVINGGILDAAAKLKTGNATPDTGALSQLLLEPEAAGFWAWHLCRKNHPDLQLAVVQAAADDKANPDAANELLADLLTATSMKQTDPNANGGSGSSS
jgi:hypothetical protein